MGPQSSTYRLTGKFTATGEDGRSYTIHVYTWSTRSYGVGGESVEVEGRRDYVTATGLGVTRLGRGRYLIDATGIALWSSDPDAP
jgi:hypothetical protein